MQPRYRLFTPILTTTLLSLYLTACGSGSGGSGGISAPTISGSSYRGLLFTTVDRNEQVDAGVLYYYDFSAGEIRNLSAIESRNPFVAYSQSKVFLFNRQAGNQNLHIFSSLNGNQSPQTTLSTSSLEAGDPADAVPTEKGLLLATPFSGGLHEVSLEDQGISEIFRNSEFDAQGGLRAAALQKSGSAIRIAHRAHRGSTLSTSALGKGLVYTLLIRSGTLAIESATGAELTTTNPGAFVSGSATRVVGMCYESLTSCTSGSSKIGSSGVSNSVSYSSALARYQLHNQIVDAGGDSFYAHVSSASDASTKVVKVNAATGTASEIHSFTSSRLFGMMSDPSSETLFVGGASEIGGHITVYQEDEKIEEIELDAVPYNGTLVE